MADKKTDQWISRGFSMRVLTMMVACLFACIAAQAQQISTWSSKTCKTCESTILYPHFYSNGAGLFGEGVQSGNTYALAAISQVQASIAVAIGISTDHKTYINLIDSVALESDSSSHTVLYPRLEPPRDLPHDFVAVEKRFKHKQLALNPNKAAGGFLFFPNDPQALKLTVVIRIDNQVFRFPFSRGIGGVVRFGDADDESVSREKQSTQQTSGPVPPRVDNAFTSIALSQSQNPTCKKNISFAVAGDGQASATVPAFVEKWVEKNGKKYPNVCFEQNPRANTENFLLVFSTAASAFNGIYPSVQTSYDSNIIPVSGAGTITDSYGSMWNYTYTGTVTTNTTTTTYASLPYTDTTRGLYVNGYSQNGVLISRRQRTITTRQGGDTYNTLGYNLGSALSSIGMKQRLLKEAVNDIVK